MVDRDFERGIASLYAAREQGDAVGREVRVWRSGKRVDSSLVNPSPRGVLLDRPRATRVPDETRSRASLALAVFRVDARR